MVPHRTGRFLSQSISQVQELSELSTAVGWLEERARKSSTEAFWSNVPQPPIHPLTCPPICPAHPPTYLHTYPSICPASQPLTYLYTYPSIHPSVLPSRHPSPLYTSIHPLSYHPTYPHHWWQKLLFSHHPSLTLFVVSFSKHGIFVVIKHGSSWEQSLSFHGPLQSQLPIFV